MPAGDGQLAARLLGVQRVAYAVEATLIRDDRIPALHESLQELRQASLLWLAAFDGDDLCGALAWNEDRNQLDIDRLVVAPRSQRRGVGMALVLEVLHRAGTRITVVSTGRDNVPAHCLYQRLGFSRIEDQEAIPGLWVTCHQRIPESDR